MNCCVASRVSCVKICSLLNQGPHQVGVSTQRCVVQWGPFGAVRDGTVATGSQLHSRNHGLSLSPPTVARLGQQMHRSATVSHARPCVRSHPSTTPGQQGSDRCMAPWQQKHSAKGSQLGRFFRADFRGRQHQRRKRDEGGHRCVTFGDCAAVWILSLRSRRLSRQGRGPRSGGGGIAMLLQGCDTLVCSGELACGAGTGRNITAAVAECTLCAVPAATATLLIRADRPIRLQRRAICLVVAEMTHQGHWL
mmetsp:Transcript_45326/g.98327  ORF Transcript_45326/g.98327 Transcript_45326/m.98327 type:complete len:251 (-) Transcript_45326:329-1081(-)